MAEAVNDRNVLAWIDAPLHRRWLDDQGQRLLDFSKASCVADGFAALDDDGQLPEDAVADTIITARMTHAYALAALRGLPGCRPLVEHGVAALLGPLHDDTHGGWMPQASDAAGRKLAYVHVFVGIAASSAKVAGVAEADVLLDRIVSVLEGRFWSEDEGAMRESFAADWSDEEDYRGANSNMHATEMAMALADVLDDPLWRTRAMRIASRIIHDLARGNRYRVAEHFDRTWQLLPEYNREKPDDDLRPYGMTPGHFLEWSHLLLKLEAALLAHDQSAPAWLLEDALGLFATGTKLGWARNGTPGIAYTIGWDDEVVVMNCPHWVLAEAATAAATLFRRTGTATYAGWYRRFWDYIDLALVDRKRGSWRNEVDDRNRPSSRAYMGKADLYHAYQATLSPQLRAAPSFATALASDLRG
jgi:sulfoquinovose isomerase